MLFRVFLLLTACAFALFFAGWVVQKSVSANLAEFMDTIGVDTLLAGFALLLTAGAFHAVKFIAADIAHYFSGQEETRRKILFAQARRLELEQRQICELRQLDYFHVLNRARLLRANDKKHLRLLAKSLYRQLRAVRDNMPRPLYKDLKKAIRAHRRRQDCEALLSLQEQITLNTAVYHRDTEENHRKCPESNAG
jgi:hypothetical protein